MSGYPIQLSSCSTRFKTADMAADRTVPRDRSTGERKEKKRKKQILLEGRECNGVVCCSTRVKEALAVQIATQWPNYLKLHKVDITGWGWGGGAHRGETLSIALKSGLLTVKRSRKNSRKGWNASSLFLSESAQPSGICICCKAVWCFAESPVTPLYPRPFAEQLKTTNARSRGGRKREKNLKKSQSNSPQSWQF